MRRSPLAPAVRRAGVALAALMLLGAVPVSAGSPSGGVDTARPAMLDPLLAGATADPIITVGETVGDYRFEALPDGISVVPPTGRGDDRHGRQARELTILVNHETSTVPFPFPADGTTATESNSQNDFDNSQLSEVVLSRQPGVVSAEMVIRSAEGFHRFCSNYLPTRREGFDRPILFTNEEGVDWVNRSGTQWPAPIGAPTARQIGAVVAHDVRTGQTRVIWGMGRLNHENSVAIPGYQEVVMLTTDDTFTTTPSQSQLYSYIADDDKDVWRDGGDLWAFRSTTAGMTRYDDFAPGSTASITGEFIRVPKLIATGRNPDGTDIKSSDPAVVALLGGSFPPPADGSWQRRPGAPSSEPGMDGPQWVLEKWSQLNDVFDFIRLEDLAYDRRPGMENVVYLVDSGRGTNAAPAQGVSTNGRIWQMVLDESNPRLVSSLSILIEGDDNPVRTPGEIHQPDNMESTPNALYFTEDPGSQQQFPVGSTDPRATTARIFQYRLGVAQGPENPRPVYSIDQALDELPGYDVDAAPAGNLGSWEASGIVDVSEFYGPGAFLVNVQSHSLWIEKAPGPDTIAPLGNPDWTYKREGGQLLLIRVPGG